jgi:hypothetical protein
MKFINILCKGVLPVLLAVAVFSLLSNTTIYGGGKKKKESLYYKKDGIALRPRVYKINEKLSLFPVPQNNAVGTNDHKNAITIISFPEGKMEMENHFISEVDDVKGGGTYLPVISPDKIGFGQIRRFLLYNFSTQTHEEYQIVSSIDETVESIAVADAQKRRFIFEIEALSGNSEDPDEIAYSLYLVDLGGKDAKLIEDIDIGTGATWTVAYNKMFLWYFDENEMQVYDMNLEPSKHPLADVITRNKTRVDFIALYPHPSLPFAILSGGVKGASFISWGEGRAQTPQPLFSSASEFSFSPDGKWVTFKKEDYTRNKILTYLMPVSEKYPNYLGSPILLSDDVVFEEKSFTWTKNPTSFVGSNGTKLYRWELTNEAYPESDKATFHDYIVAKDLKKLVRG